MEAVSGMWEDLRKAGTVPEKGMLISSCESELQELMKQVDIMVHNKKLEWDRERQTLQTRLSVREEEFIIQKETLAQKHKEIGQLRQQLCDMEKSQHELVNQYESQLTKLKSEVTGMKREYEKLRKLHSKHLSKEKTQTSTEMADSLAELRRLQSKVEDYRNKSRDWEQQKRSYQKQIDSLESHRRTLADKCQLIEQQQQGYQSQLDRRRDMLDSTESTLRSQISQLEEQLQRARDTINNQDTQIVRLRSTLEESVQSQRKALEDKEVIESEMRKCQNKFKDTEEKYSQCQKQLESCKQQMTEAESNQQQLNREIKRLQRQVIEKDEQILALEQNAVCEQQQNRAVSDAKDEIRKYRKLEKQMREELAQLQLKLSVSQEECTRLGNDLNQKLQDKLATIEERHAAQLEGMKGELAALTADLHQRNLSIASISDKAASAERHLRDQNEALERRRAEVQVCNAQLEALRLENRHLRKMSLRTAQGEMELHEAESHLSELQNAYVTSLSSLEEQNKSLKSDVATLQKKLQSNEEEANSKIQHALLQSEQSFEERRRSGEAQKAGEKRTAVIEQRLQATVSRYEKQVQSLQGEISTLQNRLDRQCGIMKKLGLEHTVMEHFVAGVDQVVQRPPHRHDSGVHDTSGSRHHTIRSCDSNSPRSPSSAGRSGDDTMSKQFYQPSSSADNTFNTMEDEDEEDYMLDPIDTVTANFLAEQEERTRELERKLDQHIETLKMNTDATIKKYTS